MALDFCIVVTMSIWEKSLQDWTRHACLAEVHAEKPGNVTPGHSFSDLSADDFVNSANAIAPVIAQCAYWPVGKVILQAIQATRRVTSTNTNLGIVLLLAPLAAVPEQSSLRDGIESVLEQLSIDDAANVYRAINLAAPGGLGDVQQQDVADVPTENLRDCMRLASERDLIASQYTNGFEHVLSTGLSLLSETANWPDCLAQRLGWIAVSLMSRFGDSLILRKCGETINREVILRANDVLSAGWPFEPRGCKAYDDFDSFLRADGNQRNPGTTADLIAAILFAGLRERVIQATESDDGIPFGFV